MACRSFRCRAGLCRSARPACPCWARRATVRRIAPRCPACDRAGRHFERAGRGARSGAGGNSGRARRGGPRSHDPLKPWPEEEFRIAIDANRASCSRLPNSMPPTSAAKPCMAQIHVTGNTGIDALEGSSYQARGHDRRRRDGDCWSPVTGGKAGRGWRQSLPR